MEHIITNAQTGEVTVVPFTEAEIAAAKLSGKKILIGSTLMLGSTRVTEIMARSGFDFLMVDLQHGPFDKASATDSIRALAVSETGAFARVAENSPGRINDLLDAGAHQLVSRRRGRGLGLGCGLGFGHGKNSMCCMDVQ